MWLRTVGNEIRGHSLFLSLIQLILYSEAIGFTVLNRNAGDFVGFKKKPSFKLKRRNNKDKLYIENKIKAVTAIK